MIPYVTQSISAHPFTPPRTLLLCGPETTIESLSVDASARLFHE